MIAAWENNLRKSFVQKYLYMDVLPNSVRASHGWLIRRLLPSVKQRATHYSQPHSVVQQLTGKGGVPAGSGRGHTKLSGFL